MVTDQQVRRLFAMKNRHEYLYQAADAAGMSCKTARKYLTRLLHRYFATLFHGISYAQATCSWHYKL